MMTINLRRNDLYRAARRRPRIRRWIAETIRLLDLEAMGVIALVAFIALVALAAIVLLAAPLWLS